ncbi:MFS transporter [Citricoccus sp. K5]|uniref:MFS transporter n=1 Tax=Citricoccus sp. K5 TaxID=2653135 RepID=UPI0012F27082|nr:MFS transporter [Citricoccus sp. K5]VXA90744.1 Putative MFS family arabinose efflux permease [Citricoccus sp. K5]
MSRNLAVDRGPSGLLGLLWIAIWGFSGFFLSYSTMVPIALDRGLSSVTGGTLLTVMMVSVIAVQPFAPALRQRWGPRRAIGGALLLMAAGHGSALVISHSMASLMVTGLAVGCGFGILVVLATAAVPAVSRPGRAGRALGQFGATTSAAAAVGAPLGLWFSGVVPLETFRLVAAALVLLALLTLPRVPGQVSPLPGRLPPAAAVVEVPGSASPAEPAAARPDAARASGQAWSGLVPVLLPFLVGMAAYGLVIAFGPGGATANPALFIATMQGSSVVGRWVAGSLTDRRSPAAVYSVGIAMTMAGLLATTFAPPGWLLAGGLAVMGLGIGTVQSASLVMAFARASSHGAASVGWNMSFDIGLGLAGVFGGLGFTYLGPGATFAGVAGLLLLASIPLWLRRRR